MPESRRDDPHVHRVDVRPGAVIDLKCGHWTEEGAIVVFNTGRRLYRCPAGCGLQDRKT